MATNLMEEGDAMVAGVLADLMVKMVPTEATATSDHLEEMVSLDKFIIKMEHFTAMDRALIKLVFKHSAFSIFGQLTGLGSRHSLCNSWQHRFWNRALLFPFRW